jgi:sugar phosphate isomerase/epimerase
MPQIAMGIWTFIFPPYEDDPQSEDSVLDRAAALGFDGVEVAWYEPHTTAAELAGPERQAAYRKKLSSRNLGLAGVVGNFDGTDSIVAGDDNSAYLATLERQLDLCKAVGGNLLRLDITDEPKVMEGLDYDTAYGRLVETWRAAARMAGDRGLRVGWEFEPGTPFNRVSEVLRIVDDVPDPAFGVIYDTTQAHNVCLGRNQLGEPEVFAGGQVELLARLSGRINHIHLIDSDGTLFEDRFSRHVPFGEGDIEWDAVLPALLAAAGGADDWWTIDVAWLEDAWDVFESGLKFVRGLSERYAG